jgi:phosphocarrier protein
MISKTVLVENHLGLHARAAARLVRAAAAYSSRISLERAGAGPPVDAKSILSVLMLAAAHGTELSIVAEGEDEVAAVDALRRLFAERFGEEA